MSTGTNGSGFKAYDIINILQMNKGDRSTITSPKRKGAGRTNQEITILHTNEVCKPAASSRQILPTGWRINIIREDHNEAIMAFFQKLRTNGANHGSIGIIRKPIAATLPGGVVTTTYVETHHFGTSFARPLDLLNKKEFVLSKAVT